MVYQGPGGSAGYDADGDVVAYQYRDAGGRIDQYAVTYLRKDSYLQSTTSGQNVSNTPNVRPATDESVYDTRGNLVALAQHTQYAGGTVADMVRVFAYDGNGEIIERRDGTANGATLDQGSTAVHENQHYVYVNGQQVAHYDEGGTLDVLAEVTAFSSSTSGPGGYVVQAGDTLQSIAQAEYGDANLWYVIAQANALSSDNDLAIGQRLTIPQVTTNSNTATTFKPYDPSSIVGSTTPNLPVIAPPPPPPSSHCNSLATIIVIAITVIVTIYTAGATSGLLAEELGTVGSAALSGAIAGAAGSLAGQAAGNALGTQHGFDWGQVAEGAIGGAIAGGVTAELQGTTSFTTGQIGADGKPVLNTAGYALQGAAGYAGNVEAAKLTNEPTHFSWAGLVANSVSNAVSGDIGTSQVDAQTGHVTGNSWLAIESKAAGDVVNRETSVGLGDHHVQSWAQLGEDVAGNAIGQPIGHAVLGAYQAYRSKQELAKINTSENTLPNNGHAAFNDPLNPQALDFSHVDTQAALELQEELAAEEMFHLGTSIGSDAPPYDVSTAPVAGETDLNSNAHGRLASTTIYSGTYVDPYLVRRNGGQADWSNTVQTFELPDQAPALFVDTTPAQPAAVPQSGLQAELMAARIGGAELGIVAASVKAVVGLAVTAKTIVGAAGDELFGGYTNAFRADADRLGGMVGAGVHFVENHPIDTTLASLKSTLDQAGELSQSSNPLDQLKAGMLIGETTTNAGFAVDGVAGLGRSGVESAGLLANGAGRLADTVGDLRFAGSASGYGGLAPSSELGAVGEDLSGFRPGASIDVGTATEVAAIEPHAGSISLTTRDVVQQAVLGDVSDSTTLGQFNTAHDFYANAGYEGERLIGHLQGIDYTQPVDLTQLESGATYVQHVLDGTKGNYFAELGTPAETLGINPAGRVPLQFTPAESVAALRSTAAKITDIWTVRGTPFEAQGGGTQLFVPNKGAMIEVPINEATAVRASTGPIQAGEITTFQDFVDRSVVGDGIEGHELWQHANLRANELTTTRLSTEASQGNPVIALDRSVHQKINIAQRLFDVSAQTPFENVNANVQILRDLNVAPEADILRLQEMAIEHARKYGY